MNSSDLAESVDQARTSAARADAAAHQERITTLSAEVAAASATLEEARAAATARRSAVAKQAAETEAATAAAAAIGTRRLADVPRVR